MSAPDQTGGEERLAPVVPLFGGPVPAAPARSEPEHAGGGAAADEWHTTWRGGEATADAPTVAGEPEASAQTDLEAAAETRVMRSLATRQLSVREAREKLRKEGLDALAVDDVIDRLVRAGALDDARLAEQLVHAALTRKNQGRRAIAQALQKRGIARDVIDEAIADLPDDDAERALDFARGKAASLARLDDDTALRRLVGQLARRGFGGSLAMNAARQALDEARSPASRVRFT